MEGDYDKVKVIREEKKIIIKDDKNGKEMAEKDIQDLDPNKIESVRVIKDEAALEKYGEKGKNGVIEISTKKD